MNVPDRLRTYFAVTDEFGHRHPAMEYLAGSLDGQPGAGTIPVKRFVKLIGSGELLESLGHGQFIGASSGRLYSALVNPAVT